MSDLVTWLPTICGALFGTGGAGVIVAWWKHTERRRHQSDRVALDLVEQQARRIDLLEERVGDLQHQLRDAISERDGLYWLLKYCPEAQRMAAVADIDRQRANLRAAVGVEDVIRRKGELRQADQMEISSRRVIAGEDA